ncbi:Trehalose phosphatase [Nitrospira japonica]|uniref:Trehalose 6-phosphate phosphatase n=1 Tax=Nitrospira japonica TaxID=1325564 RepID=A0A1W1I2Q3_9BACT|nr:trehalose-phosphatase [Nitrospira japonica]SLM47290.1 Trehalose phosphatase [Nitrospira japonica]
MIHLLSEEGRRALGALAGRPLLYAFDFDGTLAPISADRDGVTLPRETGGWLTELAKRTTCAIISGRSVADLARRVNGSVPHLIGNHGIESPLSSPTTLRLAEEVCEHWRRELANEQSDSMAAAGGEIEDKRYTLTIHFRCAPDPAAACRRALQILNRLTPAPSLIMGKHSINVLPPGQSGKGSAASALMTHLRRDGLFYIGDDETDETVFSLNEGLVMGVRVGAENGSRARFYLDHQTEVQDVLKLLTHHLDLTPTFQDSHSPGRAGSIHELSRGS